MPHACSARVSFATKLNLRQFSHDENGTKRPSQAIMPKRRAKPKVHQKGADDEQNASSDGEDYLLDAILGKAEVRLAGKSIKNHEDKDSKDNKDKDKDKDKDKGAVKGGRGGGKGGAAAGSKDGRSPAGGSFVFIVHLESWLVFGGREGLAVCLFVDLFGWFVCWFGLVGWLVGWVGGWVGGWLCLVAGRLVCLLFGCVSVVCVVCLADWLLCRALLVGWLEDGLAVRVAKESCESVGWLVRMAVGTPARAPAPRLRHACATPAPCLRHACATPARAAAPAPCLRCNEK